MGLILGLFISIQPIPEQLPEPPNTAERIMKNVESSIRDMAELTQENIDYLARVVYAEAGNQGLYGQQLVVDVILNRVDSPRFPNDLISVLNQPCQFSVVGSGAIWSKTPTEETYEAIWLEFEERQDTEILFFCAGGYNGKPAYQYKDHYFSY